MEAVIQGMHHHVRDLPLKRRALQRHSRERDRCIPESDQNMRVIVFESSETTLFNVETIVDTILIMHDD
jgi:hypothetical protein